MTATILVSDEGQNHSAERWAIATASQILPISTNIQDTRREAANDLQQRIASALIPHYASVMAQEAETLANDPDHIASPHDAISDAQQIIEDIRTMAQGSPWAEMISTLQWADSVFNTVLVHLQTAQHVERLLFADRNPSNLTAQAYKASFS